MEKQNHPDIRDGRLLFNPIFFHPGSPIRRSSAKLSFDSTFYPQLSTFYQHRQP